MGKVDKYFVASSIHGHQVLSEEHDERAGNYYMVHENCSTLEAAEDKAFDMNVKHRISTPGINYLKSLGADSPLRKGVIDYDQLYMWEVRDKSKGDIPWDIVETYIARIDANPLHIIEAFNNTHKKQGDEPYNPAMRVVGIANLLKEE